MARHLMAVCVVCLLCADHLPCKAHILNNTNNYLNGNNSNELRTSDNLSNYNNNLNSNSDNNIVYDRRKDKHLRYKRHGPDHDHDLEHHHHHHPDIDDILEKSKTYLKKLFLKYGSENGESPTMNITGFEAMLEDLNWPVLKTLNLNDIGERKTNYNTPNSNNNDSCINSIDFVTRLKGTNVKPIDLLDNENNKNNTDNSTTMNNTEKLQLIKEQTVIDKIDLLTICPILLYQKIASTSLERLSCVDESLISYNKPIEGISNDLVMDYDEHRALVWIYSSLAILGVSLCGLFGVAVIPCMDKHFYHHVLQFLVALAIGTLCGDALLHLLPHSMLTQSSHLNMHDGMMYKGLAAVGGIVFLYFMERILTVFAEWWKKRQKKDKPSSRVRVMRDPESTTATMNNLHQTEKLCKHKYSSYPYCYDEIAMDTKDDHHEHNQQQAPNDIDDHHSHNHHSHNHHAHNHNNHNSNLVKCSNHHANINEHNHDTTTQSLLQSTTTPSESKNTDQLLGNDNNTVSTNMDDTPTEVNGHKTIITEVGMGKSILQEENYTIILREHESKHHGHSHTHGHVHSPPDSLSAVAWMVIMGDGLHNFTDGMAIGAAFSNNIAGGFSTALAVFCHELPHELGDFAVLLKAGMSAKQAVYYNVLSSILSFIGMIIGVLIGDTEEASAWVFACAAGMFLYIALVDMIPELTSSHGKEESCKTSEFILQFLGMSVGFGSMLLIAMYEHNLKELFTS